MPNDELAELRRTNALLRQQIGVMQHMAATGGNGGKWWGSIAVTVLLSLIGWYGAFAAMQSKVVDHSERIKDVEQATQEIKINVAKMTQQIEGVDKDIDEIKETQKVQTETFKRLLDFLERHNP